MECPVCGKELTAKITKPGMAGKPELYFTCPEDSCHIRGFANDPAFVKGAQGMEKPSEMLAAK